MEGERYKILIVEDNQQTQLIIKVALRNEYELQSVTNVSEAISLLSNNHYNLILLDLNLQGKEDGKIILIEIREKMKNFGLPVIIISAYDLKPEDEEFFNENADGFISKPFDKETLLQTVNKILLKK